MADEAVTQTPESPETETANPSASLLDSLYPFEKPEERDVPETPPADPEAAAPEGQNEEVEEVEITTVEQLAEHFELDPEWIPNLKITQKVNGQPVEFSISDALATHRKVAAADSYLAEAKQKAKAIEEEARQKGESLTATVATFAKLLENVEAELDKDVKAIDWNKLRDDDPAEYAAKKADIKDRRERLEQMKREAAETYKQAAQKALEQQHAQLNERLPQEREMFLERVPEWKDEGKAKAEKAEIVKYLSDEGYSEEEIRVASYNGRLLALAVKAMRYDKAKGKNEAARKRVVRVPKIMKPGPKSKEAPKPNGADKKDPVSILYG